MSAAQTIRKFAQEVKVGMPRVFDRTVNGLLESVTVGNGITTSPGQPVDSHDLQNSIRVTERSSHSATIKPDEDAFPRVAFYAAKNEFLDFDDESYRQRSPTGGRHSFALTKTGFPDLVEAIIEEEKL